MSGQGCCEAGGRNDWDVVSKIFAQDAGGEGIPDAESSLIERIKLTN